MAISKLEAVNIILAAIGEDPVSSLSSGLGDAEIAESKLDAVKTDVLAKGWHCNTEDEVYLTPDSDSYIQLPSNTLRVDSSYTSAHIDVVQRGTRLYNLADRTYEFDDGIYCKIVYDLDWDELTHEMQRYIAAKAARIFQEEKMGSVALDGFTVRNEAEAKAALDDSEDESGDYNVLRDSPSVRLATRRNNRLYGIG